MGGFRYCGRALSEFGNVYYIPDETARGAHTADYEVYETERDGSDGGYRTGTRVKTKEFGLDIYYENMERKQLNRLLALFDRNTKGELVFDDRPYARYTASPSGRIELQEYRENRNGKELLHGTMRVAMKCYDPFAKLDQEADLTQAEGEIYIPEPVQTPPTPSANMKEFLIYNPGTEFTPATLKIAGDGGEQMIIRNRTTGQECLIRGMTSGITADAGRYLEINGETGRVELVGAERTLAFELHDGGYIGLAPNRDFETECMVKCSANSAVITMMDGARAEMVGRYMYLQGGWRQIIRQINQEQVMIDALMTKSQTAYTDIVVMNAIEIEGGNLTTLEIEFEPRVR